MYAPLRRKAEAIRADDRTAVNRAARPDAAVLAHNGVRVERRPVADLAVLPDVGMRIERHACADHSVVVHIGKGQDGRARADADACADVRLVAHTDRVFDHRSKDREQLCKRSLGIVHIDHRTRKALRAAGQKEGTHAPFAGACLINMRGHGKGEIVHARLIESGKAFYDASGVAARPAANQYSNLTDCLFHA